MPTINPASAPVPYSRPGGGSYTWRGEDDDSVPGGSVDAYDRPKWRQIEGTRGVYNWSSVDTILNRAAAQGGMAIVGLVRNKIAGGDDAYPTWYGPISNWNDETFVAAQVRLIEAAGARYDGRILAVEMRNLGLYGEDHSHNATMATRERIVEAFLRAFPNTPFVHMSDNRPGVRWVQTLSHAPGIWLRRDSVGGINEALDNSLLTDPWEDGDIPFDAWERHCIVGELAGDLAPRDGDTNWKNRAIDEPRDLGMTYLGNGNYHNVGSTHRDDIAESMRGLGAAIRVVSVAVPDTLNAGNLATIRVVLTNPNPGRLYEPWRCVLELSRSGSTTIAIPLGAVGNLRTPLSGSAPNYAQDYQVTIPASVGTGTWTARFYVDSTRRNRRYPLANEGLSNNSLLVGSVTVGTGGGTTPPPGPGPQTPPPVVGDTATVDLAKIGGTRYVFRASQQYDPIYELPGNTIMVSGPYTAWEARLATQLALQLAGGSANQSARALIYEDNGTASSDAGRVRGEINGYPGALVGVASSASTIPANTSMQERAFDLGSARVQANKLYWVGLWLGGSPATRAKALRQHQSSKAILTVSQTFSTTGAPPSTFPTASVSTQANVELSMWFGGIYEALIPPSLSVQVGLRPGELRLAWTAGDARFTHYRVDRSLNGTTWETAAITRQRAITDTGLASGTTYRYRVAGVVGSQVVLSSVATGIPSLGTARPMTTITPTLLAEDTILANPLRGMFVETGTGTGTTPASTVADIPVLEAERRQRLVDWAIWEPQQNTYSRSAMDAWLAAVTSTSAKRRAAFRLTRLIVPGQSPSCLPTWLQRAPYAVLNGSDWTPQWDQPDLLRWSESLFARIGSWYNGDPRIARVDIGWFNLYGEWTGGAGNAAQASLRRIIDAALLAFPNTFVSCNFPSADKEATLLYFLAKRNGYVGIRQDALGDPKTNYMWSQYEGTRSDRARRWMDDPRHYRQAELIDWPQISGNLSGAMSLAAYDVRMLGIQSVSEVNIDGALSGAAATSWRTMIAEAGYRYTTPRVRVATTIALSQAAPAQVTWRNTGTGTASIDPWKVVWQLRNSGGTVVWSQESTVALADILPREFKGFRVAPDVTHEDSLLVSGIATGEYTLGLQIPAFSDYVPAMQLHQGGSSGSGANRWYPVSSVSIVANTGGGTTPTVPPQPTNLVAAGASQIAIALSWNVVLDATSILLERSTTGTGGWTSVATLTNTTTTYTDTGLSPNTAYYYRITGINGAGNSLPSSVASASTLASGGGAIQLVANVPATSGAASTTSLTFTRPATVQAGDVLLLLLGHRTNTSMLTVPNGWAVVPGFPVQWASPTPSLKHHALVRIAGASEAASYTFTVSSATRMVGQLLVIRGADTASPVIIAEGTAAGAGTTLTETINVGTQAGALVVWSSLVANDPEITTPGGMTALTQVSNDDEAGGAVLRVATEVAAVTGSITRAGTSSASTNSVTGLIAFKPVAGTSVPSEPINLIITATSPTASTASMVLAWTNTASDATAIVVERQQADGTWETRTTLAASATTYTDAGAPVTSYSYRVSASNASGRSPYLTGNVTTPPPPLPGTPTGLAAVATEWDSVELEWTDAATGEIAYRIERRQGSGPWIVLQDDLPAGTEAYIDTTIAPETAYQYRVAAVGPYGLGSYATSSVITTPPNTSAWDWADMIRPLPDRIGVLQIIAQNVMGYVALTEDGVRWRYYAGPLVDGRLTFVGEGYEGLIAAQANAIVLPTEADAVLFPDGSFGGRLELTEVRRARICRVGIKRISSTEPAAMAEWFARTLAVADDALFGSIRAIHIQAEAVEVSKHLKAGTFSTTFWMASQNTSWREGEGFYLGYLPEGDPQRDAFTRFRVGAPPGAGPSLRWDRANGQWFGILEQATLQAPVIDVPDASGNPLLRINGQQGITINSENPAYETERAYSFVAGERVLGGLGAHYEPSQATRNVVLSNADLGLTTTPNDSGVIEIRSVSSYAAGARVQLIATDADPASRASLTLLRGPTQRLVRIGDEDNAAAGTANTTDLEVTGVTALGRVLNGTVRLLTRGLGITSDTFGAIFENSQGTHLFTVRDDGKLQVRNALDFVVDGSTLTDITMGTDMRLLAASVAGGRSYLFLKGGGTLGISPEFATSAGSQDTNEWLRVWINGHERRIPLYFTS
jgi:hypothetical protein